MTEEEKVIKQADDLYDKNEWADLYELLIQVSLSRNVLRCHQSQHTVTLLLKGHL